MMAVPLYLHCGLPHWDTGATGRDQYEPLISPTRFKREMPSRYNFAVKISFRSVLFRLHFDNSYSVPFWASFWQVLFWIVSSRIHFGIPYFIQFRLNTCNSWLEQWTPVLSTQNHLRVSQVVVPITSSDTQISPIRRWLNYGEKLTKYDLPPYLPLRP